MDKVLVKIEAKMPSGEVGFASFETTESNNETLNDIDIKALAHFTCEASGCKLVRVVSRDYYD